MEISRAIGEKMVDKIYQARESLLRRRDRGPLPRRAEAAAEYGSSRRKFAGSGRRDFPWKRREAVTEAPDRRCDGGEQQKFRGPLARLKKAPCCRGDVRRGHAPPAVKARSRRRKRRSR